MGKSASGKDTLYRRLLADCPELHTNIMYTTRPKRAGETDGQSYFFVTEDLIARFEGEGKLIEKRVYQTINGPWIYATIDDGQIDLLRGDYLITGTLQSYLKMREYFGEGNVFPLYIDLDDGERLLRALKREKQEPAPNYREMCRRFLADAEDFSEENLKTAGIVKRYDNSDLESCLSELCGEICRSEQRQTER